RHEGPEQFWGFSNVVIRVDALLKSAQFQALVEQGFAYRLDRVDLETPLVISENNAEALVEPVVIEMSLPGVRWRLALAPESGWFPAHLWLIYGIACIGVAGLVARFVFMGLRIKEQKELLSILLTEQTEHANASDDRLNRTLMAIPDPLLEVSQTGDVINARMPNDESELADYFKEGESFKAHLPESVIEVFEFVFQEVLRSDTLSHRGAVFSLPINEQTKLWFEMSVVFQASPKSGESGNYVVLLRDISIRHESEQQLRIAATAFETQDGMLISDQHNRIIKVNQAFQKISGYSESEVIGQTPAILQSGRHDKSFYECMFEQLANKGTWEGEVWNKRKNGEIYPEWLSISTVQDYLGQVSHYVATFKDISERKASERQIRQLNYYDSLTRLANRTLLLE
ncbi:MAG: PAS domain S-box protein, partial [Pseudomonadota bacterium]|nr:PAS domain S-box protein [Pseudomonadota bacterium]